MHSLAFEMHFLLYYNILAQLANGLHLMLDEHFNLREIHKRQKIYLVLQNVEKEKEYYIPDYHPLC